jgi:(E)-4-hydroxy-3-methylbut-2-enyl-diphosphate synthase
VEEVKVGLEILKSLKLRQTSPEVIACPLCGRCEVNLIPVVHEVEESLRHLNKPISVAVMGCVVNGPGEAREADVGIACGKGVGLIFKKGEIVRKVSEEEFAKALIEEARNLK